MRKHELKEYMQPSEYKEFIETLYAVVGLMLFSITRLGSDIKRIIIRNFIARSIISLKGIICLWEIKNYHDCYVLLRGIAERFFHLHDLIVNDRFEDFDDWSFFNQFTYRNNIRSDKVFSKKIISEFYKETDEVKKRYEKLSKNKPTYKRPNPEQTAKDLGLPFIYKFGYDHASSLVHPLSDDGWEDFITITGLGDLNSIPDHRVVLNNSILYVLILIQEAIEGLNVLWLSPIVDFMNDAMEFIKSGSKKYQFSFIRIGNIDNTKNLCIEKDKDNI